MEQSPFTNGREALLASYKPHNRSRATNAANEIVDMGGITITYQDQRCIVAKVMGTDRPFYNVHVRVNGCTATSTCECEGCHWHGRCKHKIAVFMYLERHEM